jgi:hypothetical protein
MWFAPVLEALASAAVAAIVSILKNRIDKKKEASPKEKLPPCKERSKHRHSRHQRNSGR